MREIWVPEADTKRLEGATRGTRAAHEVNKTDASMMFRTFEKTPEQQNLVDSILANKKHHFHSVRGRQRNMVYKQKCSAGAMVDMHRENNGTPTVRWWAEGGRTWWCSSDPLGAAEGCSCM